MVAEEHRIADEAVKITMAPYALWGGCSVRITFALIVAGPSLARLLEPHLRCASESGPLYTVGRILASLAVSVPMPTRTSTHSAASRTCTLCRVPLSLQPDRGEPARGRLRRAICNCIMFVGWETISRARVGRCGKERRRWKSAWSFSNHTSFLDNNAFITVLVGFLESTGEAAFHNRGLPPP